MNIILLQGCRLLGSAIRVLDVWDDTKCLFLCLSDPRCVSVNCKRHKTKPSQRRCQLNRKTKSESSEHYFQIDKQCNYYESVTKVGVFFILELLYCHTMVFDIL